MIWVFLGEQMSKTHHNSCSIPKQCVGHDPGVLALAFHHQGPTFINAYCQAATKLVGRD